MLPPPSFGQRQPRQHADPVYDDPVYDDDDDHYDTIRQPDFPLFCGLSSSSLQVRYLEQMTMGTDLHRPVALEVMAGPAFGPSPGQ